MAKPPEKTLAEQIKEIMGNEHDSRTGKALALIAQAIDELNSKVGEEFQNIDGHLSGVSGQRNAINFGLFINRRRKSP